MKSSLPAPAVTHPAFVDGSIDLEVLKTSPLNTRVNYPGIKNGDQFWVLFKGVGPDGAKQDALESKQTVLDPPADGMEVLIDNALLHTLNLGYVFYSYAMDNNGAPGEESDRLFMFVNKALDPSLGLPPAQFLESYQLVVDLDVMDATASDGTMVAAPYQAMAIGDVVTFTWQSYFEGVPDLTDGYSKTLTEEDLGQPLTWRVPYNNMALVGFADIHYSIAYADGAGSTQSPVQRLQLLRDQLPPDPLLAAPTVKGLAGDKLDPGAYPDGVVFVIAPPLGLQQGDIFLLQAQGTTTAQVSLRVDLTTLHSQRLELRLGQDWLLANVGQPVSIEYHWARLGEASRSLPLALTLRKPLSLPALIVSHATPEGEGDNQGFLLRNLLESGAVVDVPEGAETSGGVVEVHWAGYGSTGYYSTTTPVHGYEKRYKIPRTAIPANLGKSFDVYYTVTLAGEKASPSTVYVLRIADYPNNPFPSIQCEEAVAGHLSLAAVTGAAANFKLATWPFFAEGQRVRIQASGTEKAVQWDLRKDLPVTEDEYYGEYLAAELPKSYLQALKLNTVFDVRVAVSFDDGVTWKDFPTTRLTLGA
ncbi:hypothetical protein CCOS865_04324 [Pseudomonas reidholzensis]|uniref:Uncharacterized protein n=1 Tax=Pseudomonas reidholzensis TaxID=1785162 RepID=A0A383RZH4_9PSED|nr:hypothetical protein [Pseudomonas reidholzensis]SYX92044.1 hypothetical protein CCOS865_04324 [Pseudomonas reidholzensis]